MSRWIENCLAIMGVAIFSAAFGYYVYLNLTHLAAKPTTCTCQCGVKP